MKHWQWSVFCLFFFIFFLAIYAPASLVYYFVPVDSGVEIDNANGTILNGRADSLSINGIRINNVMWSLSPIKLLTGKLSVEINGGELREPSETYVNGVFHASLLNSKVFGAKELMAHIPLKSLLAQLKLPVSISTQGRIKLEIAEFENQDGCSYLTGTGEWPNAVIRLNNQSVELGDFEANLECQSSAFKLSIGGNNKFNLNAQIVISSDGSISNSGTFAIDPSLPNEIQQAALFFGKSNEDGSFTISM